MFRKYYDSVFAILRKVKSVQFAEKIFIYCDFGFLCDLCVFAGRSSASRRAAEHAKIWIELRTALQLLLHA